MYSSIASMTSGTLRNTPRRRRRWGQPLLFGPGSVLVAHTADEHVRIDQLRAAIGHYARIATTLLERSES